MPYADPTSAIHTAAFMHIYYLFYEMHMDESDKYLNTYLFN